MLKPQANWRRAAELAADATLAYLASQASAERRNDFYVRSAHIRSNDKAYRFVRMLVDEGYDMAAPYVREIAAAIQIALLHFPGIKQSPPDEHQLLAFILARRWGGHGGVLACVAEWSELQRQRKLARAPLRRIG